MKIPPTAGLKPETTRSTGQCLTLWATGAQLVLEVKDYLECDLQLLSGVL